MLHAAAGFVLYVDIKALLIGSYLDGTVQSQWVTCFCLGLDSNALQFKRSLFLIATIDLMTLKEESAFQGSRQAKVVGVKIVCWNVLHLDPNL